MAVAFITGIDTGIGKTYVTGLIARVLAAHGRRVITQKLIQTGCRGASEDIAEHRRIMGIASTPEDIAGLTCPCILAYPASPHLAAAMESRTIDPARLHAATAELATRYQDVLIEGVGGLEVPISDTFTTLDYVAQHDYPLIVVSSPRLGSINHTLLTLRAARASGLDVWGIVYNRHGEQDRRVGDDTRRVLDRAIKRHPRPGWIVDVPAMHDAAHPLEPDWAPLLENFEERQE